MIARFKDKRITGIVSVLPEAEILFDDEAKNYAFPERQTLRLKKIMGYSKHRVSKATTATSDLCVYGMDYLLENGLLKRDEICALLVVTTTPDYFMPNVSNIIQSHCGLPDTVLCLDMAQGCVGFIVGLLQSFMLLEHFSGKVVLFNADVLSHKVSKQDRNSYPLIGDAATITIIENAQSPDITFYMRMDGSRGMALCIPAGGSRMPCTVKTAEMQPDADGNIRCLDNLRMDGSAVFEYVQQDAPPIILETLAQARLAKEQIDWFLFHQPNRFMLRKLAEKLEVPYEKVPMNIVENFGNPSGASIPLCITHNLADTMINAQSLCCLSAFGSGLACGAITMELGKMDFCETLYSNL